MATVLGQFWTSSQCTAGVAMPETAVYEYHLPSFGKNEVRLSGKIGSVEPEFVTACPCDPPDQEFRFRILATDKRHALTTLSAR